MLGKKKNRFNFFFYTARCTLIFDLLTGAASVINVAYIASPYLKFDLSFGINYTLIKVYEKSVKNCLWCPTHNFGILFSRPVLSLPSLHLITILLNHCKVLKSKIFYLIIFFFVLPLWHPLAKAQWFYS